MTCLYTASGGRMTLKLTREMKKLIHSQIGAGKYDSPDEVILAALGTDAKGQFPL